MLWLIRAVAIHNIFPEHDKSDLSRYGQIWKGLCSMESLVNDVILYPYKDNNRSRFNHV